jgi:opacity protein-like surface antigen
MIKRINPWLQVALTGTILMAQGAHASEFAERWNVRLDMGGVVPEDATLTEFGGPVSGDTLKLNPGFQLDVAMGYRILPWLEVGPEFGFTFNTIDSVGGWSYPDSSFGQILMMANVRIEYPPQSRLAPYVGAGIGGVASFMTFGATDYYSYYHYYEPDGTGTDFVLGYQVFAGLRYRMAEQWNLGIQYRYLVTGDQHWNVDWWNGAEFGISTDGLRMHSICLVFSGDF